MLCSCLQILDMDTSVMTEMQLAHTFNSLYVSLPAATTQIDDTANCSQPCRSENNSAQSTRMSVRFCETLDSQNKGTQASPVQPRVTACQEVAAAQEPPARRCPEDAETATLTSENIVCTTSTKTVHRGERRAEQIHRVEQREVLVEPACEAPVTNAIPLPDSSPCDDTCDL